MKLPRSDHHVLVQDLAHHMVAAGRIVFAEVGIGSRWLQGGSLPVPDVLTLARSYTRPMQSIYEVKASRADFHQDVARAKWESYLPFCRRLYFACRKGLLKKSEIPEGVGLIVLGENGWHTVVTPRVHDADGWNMVCVQALLMSGSLTAERVRRLQDRVNMNENLEIADRVKSLGYEIRELVSAGRKRAKEPKDLQDAGRFIRRFAEAMEIDISELEKMRDWDFPSRFADRDKQKELLRLICVLAQQAFHGTDHGHLGDLEAAREMAE